jgi:hypothetical protein
VGFVEQVPEPQTQYDLYFTHKVGNYERTKYQIILSLMPINTEATDHLALRGTYRLLTASRPFDGENHCTSELIYRQLFCYSSKRFNF